MAHVQRVVMQSQLHLGGQFEQTQEVGDGGAFLADALAQPFLGEVVLVDKFPEGQRDFDGVQVLTLDVLDERHLGHLAVVGRSDVGRNGVQPGQQRCAVATFTRDDLVGVVAHAAQGQWLDDAQLADACRQLFKCLLVKDLTGLLGVGHDLVDGYLVDGRGAFGLDDIHVDECVETALECFTFHYIVVFLVELIAGLFVARDDFVGQLDVARGAAAVGVILRHGHAVAGRLADAGVARDDRVEDHVAEVALQLLINLVGEPETGVIHGEQEALDAQAGIELGLDDADGVEQLADALQCEILGLDRNDDAVGRGQGVDRDQAQRGAAVDNDVVIVVLDQLQGLAQHAFTSLFFNEFQFGSHQVDA